MKCEFCNSAKEDYDGKISLKKQMENKPKLGEFYYFFYYEAEMVHGGIVHFVDNYSVIINCHRPDVYYSLNFSSIFKDKKGAIMYGIDYLREQVERLENDLKMESEK